MDFQRKQSYLELPIEVGVRLRPVLDTDDPPSDERVEVLPSRQVTVEGHVFSPEFCLPEDVTQAELYHAAVAPQVDMLLQGYNVAVVMFGQTGSGKTYTLVGPEATFAMPEAEFGILPRAVRDIFAALKSSEDGEQENGFTVRTSYLEVGQEEIRDLLNYEAVSYRLDVEFDQQGSPVIPGLTQLECSSVAEVLHCLESGASMRQAGSTAGSDQQAHTVFTVHVHQEWADGVLLHQTSSAFQFVECSGSELQPAPDDPDDFTINAGLLALQELVQTLVQRRPSVPRAAAKLPAVLKDVIGGNCRTLLICCLSPGDTDESLAALQYVSPFSHVHNMVTCSASQRPLPPPQPSPPVPPRQVHHVHPLRHQLASSPPGGEHAKPPPAQRHSHQPAQPHWSVYRTHTGVVENSGWSPDSRQFTNYQQSPRLVPEGEVCSQGQAMGGNASHQGGGQEVYEHVTPQVVRNEAPMMQRMMQQDHLWHLSSAQNVQGEPMTPRKAQGDHIGMHHMQSRLGSNGMLETQEMRINSPQVVSHQLMSPPMQGLMSPGMRPAEHVFASQVPLTRRDSQHIQNNGNAELVVRNQIIRNEQSRGMHEQRTSSNQGRDLSQQQCMNQSREYFDRNQQFVNHGPVSMEQNNSPMNANHVISNHQETPVSNFPPSRRLSLHTLYQNSINRDQPLNTSANLPLANPAHRPQNLSALNHTLPPGPQQQQVMVHQSQEQMSPNAHPSLMTQTLPPMGSNNNLMVGHMRSHVFGHQQQQAMVHPFHHHHHSARLPELGYTASPPLTNLTELSCHRAALLHENALVDLYQRLHVLELHHLAAVQQAALASQQQQQEAQAPAASASEAPKDDDQLFQLEFAAEQYRSLVAAAERLLQELSLDGEQRGRVQEWMCRKQETDECLENAGGVESDDELRRLEGAGAQGSAASSEVDAEHRKLDASAAAAAVSANTGEPVTELCNVLTSSRRVADPVVAEPGADGTPPETSTPNDSSSADRQVAVQELHSRLQQLSGARETKTDVACGSARPGGDSQATASGSLKHSPAADVGRGSLKHSPAADGGRSSLKHSPAADVGRGSLTACGAPALNRRRRAACTEDDLRVIRLSEDSTSLEARLSGDNLFTLNPPNVKGRKRSSEVKAQRRSSEVKGRQRSSERRQRKADVVEQVEEERMAAGVCLVNRSVDACDPAELELGPDLTAAPAGEHSDIKREIQKLRDCRDSLHSQRKRINTKIYQGGQLDGAETRRLLELDEALHAVDEVLEHKAARLAGGAAPADGRTLLLNQRRLMPRLQALGSTELRLLYCRTFQRLVDQRIDGREKDLAVADLDAQTDEQRRGLKRLQRMVHDLMKERSHYRRQRDELRRRLHTPRHSGGATVAPPIPAVVAPLSHEPGTPIVARAGVSITNSRAPSDASSVPEPALAPTSAPNRLRQMLLSGLSRPSTSSPTARVTRQRNRVIIQSASQGSEKRTRR